MRLHRPFEALTPTLDGDVLQVLARAEASFTGGQLARLIPDASREGVRRAAQRLAAQGMVLEERAGRAYTYTLNRDHLLADAVVRIARARDELSSRTGDHVDRWREKPEVLVLFGSAAQGQMQPNSDIDLFVVGSGSDAWDQQLMDLEQAVRRWTGNDCRVLAMTPDELETAFEIEPVLDDILRDGQVLWGPSGWLRSRRRIRRSSTATP